MATVAQAQSRGAVWVHGLGSDANEWAQWANLFTAERQLNTLSRGSFTSENGVANMAGQVRGSYTANEQSIYFGHSLGGVVGRQIDATDGNTFGAIITAGSAHDGARIANAAGNGELVNAVSDGIDALASGPGGDPTLNLLTGGLFNVAGIVVSVAANYLKQPAQVYLNNNFLNQTAQDLSEGSGYLNGGPRTTQTNTPKLLIYGNEESPVHWRIASEAAFNDERMADWANTAFDIYSAAMWTNYGLAAAVGAVTFGLGAIPFVASAIRWSRGMNWVRYDSERVWNYLIGAGIPATFTVCQQNINWGSFGQCMNAVGQGATYDDYIRCQQQNSYQSCYTYYASTNGQSDGFIKAPSQSGFNSAWASNAIRVEAQGVNHLQMKKHPRMRDIYNQAFDGTYGFSFRVAR
ncbi:alpha/beta hydrolase [Fibrella aquatilis]|uniref:Alpha/beta hydrolase n=1 Tax=Fibrella aquatilis TaxID=2817059 RepID=A0A939JZ32_9BACT|nr:alpha/beta hydrolase [Fibrella aquatilis]MBO0930506.1 alpha/beta hydrolase [Fibrella aquatilis]